VWEEDTRKKKIDGSKKKDGRHFENVRILY
jgi:hypothetical protein